MQSPHELFDVCDAEDHVIGQATRAEVHARQLLHRAVHIWIFRSDGRLVTQRRSATKDQYPSTLTSSASGHVDAGEDYLSAALRELREELGLTGHELQRVVKLSASPQTAYEHTVLFLVTTDEELTPDPEEVSGLETYTLLELQAELSRRSNVSCSGKNEKFGHSGIHGDPNANQDSGPDQLSPPFRELLRWWMEGPPVLG